MAFQSKDLSVLAYANNFTLWHYVTSDSDVTTDRYFDQGAHMLRLNDLIIANVNSASKAATSFYIVTANDGERVSVQSYAQVFTEYLS